MISFIQNFFIDFRIFPINRYHLFWKRTRINGSCQPKLSFFVRKRWKRALLSTTIFQALLSHFKKMEIIVVSSKIELLFDINRSSSIIIKLIKNLFFNRAKNNRWVRYHNVFVINVCRNKLPKKKEIHHYKVCCFNFIHQ